MSYLAIFRAAEAKLRSESPPTPDTGGAVSLTPPRAGESQYAFPWPDSIPGLGHRRVQAFNKCTDCGVGTWIAYGSRVLCLVCATRRAGS
jgi:hypothetical protein